MNTNELNLLLISNSTNAGEAYLEYPLPYIQDFIPGIRRIAFVPYAGVTFDFDAYQAKVQKQLGRLGIEVESIHRTSDPARALQEAECIVVGGGNTWQLLDMMQRQGLLATIRARVQAGIPYIGWSAGSNVACPTIRTTNDMPITEPQSFEALGLVNFQINPHYLDANPEGHAGETREDRILEFIEVNRTTTVVGLREGTMLRLRGGRMELLGPRAARIFRHGNETFEVQPGDDLRFLAE